MFGERRVWNAKRVKTVELSVDDVMGLATMRHALAVWLEFVERDDHVWKIAHEPARDFESRSRRSVVHC